MIDDGSLTAASLDYLASRGYSMDCHGNYVPADEPGPYHEHECRSCGASIPCHQSDAECDANGGIGQYGGDCADCNASAEPAHSLDCDGYMTEHVADVVRISYAGRGMLAATCDCGWSGTMVGPDARGLAERQAQRHTTRPEPCDGRCIGIYP